MRSLQIDSLKSAYEGGALSPAGLIEEVLEAIASYPDQAVFISLTERDALLEEARALEERKRTGEALPLFGVPFAVKDNIDCAGLPTTAGCPAFAYVPDTDAPSVAKLKAAGALMIGKTNMDQFATGLVGTRSPYGAPRSVFDDAYISGGSSSGSAVAVAAGLVSVALGTDTAGSGRVPAAFNSIVGVKPSPGLLSTRGVVPACRSLDCVSVFATGVADATAVRRVAEGADPGDPYSRVMTQAPVGEAAPRLGALPPEDRNFFGDDGAAALYEEALRRCETLGSEIVGVDFEPFLEAAAMLYQEPFVAERTAAVGDFIKENPERVDPIVARIVEGGREASAVALHRARQRIAALRTRARAIFETIDALLLPTAPTIYRVDQIAADPVGLNARLGTYTNFVNLLDLAAIAVPAGMTAKGLPFGVSLIAPAGCDDRLALWADRLQRASSAPVGRTGFPLAADPLEPDKGAAESVTLAVVGAHLRGEPLNHELRDRGASFIEQTRTAPCYRLFALGGTVPPKPGLKRDPGFDGPGIELELWQLPLEGFASFVAGIPAPLGIGGVELEDGREVKGFICEPSALEDAREITAFGGWRAFKAAQ